MRHGFLLLMAAGCGFTSTAATSDAPDAPDVRPVPDGGVPATWTFDSVTTFGASGHTVKDMTVDAHGLTPNAYTYGGLVAHGLQGMKLWMGSDTSWSRLDGVTATGAGLWCGEELINSSVLEYFGITNNAVMTVWFEGEVWLESGSTESFLVAANDTAFVDLARPGTTAYARVADNGVPRSVATPETGWYPIRIGFEDGDDSSSFKFTHDDAGATPMTLWTRDRLRARTSELTGMLRTVYGRQLLASGLNGPPVPHFEQRDLLPFTDFDPQPPQGGGATDWSARYLGQVYVTQVGSYTLKIISDDGNRGRLGSGRGENHWSRDDGSGGTATTSNTTATLIAGWNDVAVDYNQVSGGQGIRVQLQGPDSPSFKEIPRDRLRPVAPADDRLAVGGEDTVLGVTDNGGSVNPATGSMTIVGYAGETVASIDVTYEVDAGRWDDIQVDLETPGGMRATIRTAAPLAPGNNRVLEVTVPSNASGMLGMLLHGPASGTWKLHVYDIANGGGGTTFKNARLTLHTTGGLDKIARAASWTSPVLDATTNVFAIDGATSGSRLPGGSALEIHVRTCQQADCSDNPPWSPPVSENTAFTVDPQRYLQLRVDMTSNGLLEPELNRVSVSYRRAPG